MTRLGMASISIWSSRPCSVAPEVEPARRRASISAVQPEAGEDRRKIHTADPRNQGPA